jgi:hypothetical protein
MKYKRKQRTLHTKKITINQILIYSGGRRGEGETGNALMLSPSTCQDSESPTLGILPPTPPLKTSTQPQRKKIARVETNFLIPKTSQTKREGTRG